MKPSKPKTDSQELTGIVQLARLRVEAAEKEWKSAKERAGLARRRRKEAKQAARRAKKQVKLAKREVAEARAVLADAEAKLAKPAKSRIVAAPAKKATGTATSPVAKSRKTKRAKPAVRIARPRSLTTDRPGQGPEPAAPTSPTPGDTAA